MESSIWVAVITCLPASYTFLIIIFCAIGTSSSGSSTPISPLATIIASDASIISSILVRPSAFSILEIILIFSPPLSFNSFLISLTSAALLTKEAATKSTSCEIPKHTSSISTLLKKGILTCEPGTLTPLWLDTCPPLITLHTISSPSIFSTTISTSPSSIRIWVPFSTSL